MTRKKPDLAPGRLDDVITYLEMTARPVRPPVPMPSGKIALMRAETCTVSYYRYLYASVGEPWLWFERRIWSDERLAEHLAKPSIEISVLYVGGVPAGFFELDRELPEEVELAYFGLVPDFIGRGCGAYLLQAAVASAWATGGPKRVWVHTCTFDHPRALGVYQRAGFIVYQRAPVVFDDPRLSGALPRTLSHPLLPPLPTG
jgi:GNAT superfamily N-acetyltransferase